MSRLPQRAHSTVLRTNSLRSLTRNDNSGIIDVPIIMTPHYDLIPPYEVEDHAEPIDISKSIMKQTIKKQNPKIEKEDSYFLPFFEIDFNR